jgi:hypothetical protein
MKSPWSTIWLQALAQAQPRGGQGPRKGSMTAPMLPATRLAAVHRAGVAGTEGLGGWQHLLGQGHCLCTRLGSNRRSTIVMLLEAGQAQVGHQARDRRLRARPEPGGAQVDCRAVGILGRQDPATEPAARLEQAPVAAAGLQAVRQGQAAQAATDDGYVKHEGLLFLAPGSFSPTARRAARR